MAATLQEPGSRVRVRPAPASDPPFDDDWSPLIWSATAAQPPLQLATRPPRQRQAAAPTAPAGVGAATRAASAQFMQACLEVLNGYRPVAHLRALSSPLEAAGVLEAMTAATRRLAREAGSPPSGRSARVKLQRMRVCEPRPGVAEISAVISTLPRPGGATRCWAGAFRLEHQQGRWRCTVARVL